MNKWCNRVGVNHDTSSNWRTHRMTCQPAPSAELHLPSSMWMYPHRCLCLWQSSNKLFGSARTFQVTYVRLTRRCWQLLIIVYLYTYSHHKLQSRLGQHCTMKWYKRTILEQSATTNQHTSLSTRKLFTSHLIIRVPGKKTLCGLFVLIALIIHFNQLWSMINSFILTH